MLGSPPMSTLPRRWRAVATEPLQDCSVFEVMRTHARSPRTGRAHPFYRLEAADWVNVVALTGDGCAVLVRQYRHGSDEITLEIPGGMVDPGESPREAAARELLEETGYEAAAWDDAGSLSPNPALFGNRVHTFVARGCRRVGAVRNEGHEETCVELVPEEDLRRLVAEGGIDHALVVAAIFRAALREEGA